MNKNKLLIALMVLTFALADCSSVSASTPAGTGTKDDPVLMVVTGEFSKDKMSEVLAEINVAKKYVILDLSQMTGDMFDLDFLNSNGKEYIVSLKLPGVAKSIVGPDGLRAEDWYPNITTVTIPKSVTDIGVGAFSGCTSLAAINVDAANMAYSSQDGVLYNKGKTVLHTYPLGKADSSFAIPNGVTSIGESAFFYCKVLTSVTIPNSVTSIGNLAFSYCSNITSVTIPDSVTSIGDWAFEGCVGLTCVTIPNSVTYIGENAFSSIGLTAINVESTNTTYSSQDGVLYNKSKTALQIYPSGKAVSSFTIPNSVTSLGPMLFTTVLTSQA